MVGGFDKAADKNQISAVWPVRSKPGVASFLPATGQMLCYGRGGGPGYCGNSGEDGKLQMGVKQPSPRFTAGTGAEANCVIDNLTGLMWPKAPDSNLRTWQGSLDYVANTMNNGGLCGHKDWRLPNINELLSLKNAGYNEVKCGGVACASNADWLTRNTNNTQPPQGLFQNVANAYYWSSTTYAQDRTGALDVFMRDGAQSYNYKTNTHYVWPVRTVTRPTIYAATTDGLSVSSSTYGNGRFMNYTTENGLGSNNVNNVYVYGGTIYAATQNGLSISGLSIPTAGGAHFNNYTTANGLGSNNVNSVYVSDGTIYAATGNGLSISTDGGAHFTNYPQVDGSGYKSASKVFVSDGTIYAVTTSGVSLSTDGGAHFTYYPAATWLGRGLVFGIYVSGGTIYVATYDGSAGLFISTDNCAHFTSYSTANGLPSNNLHGIFVQ